MSRSLLLLPIVAAILGGSAVSDLRNSPSVLKGGTLIIKSTSHSPIASPSPPQLLAPDLKMHIDSVTNASGAGDGCLGPIKVVNITVTNVGNLACRAPKRPTAFGYSQVSDGQAVLFEVTSVGSMPISLTPGAKITLIVKNATCNGQKAIAQGYFEVNQPICNRERIKSNNKATRVYGTTSNPN